MCRLVLIAVVMILVSCSNKENQKEIQGQHKIAVKKEIPKAKISIDFTLDTFTAIPEEVDGCSCYFYLSEQDQKNEKYIYVNDFANLAYVSINGEIIEFELKSYKEGSGIYVYSNDVYRLKVIVLEEKEDGYESTFKKGKIILSKGDMVVEKDFLGTCGC